MADGLILLVEFVICDFEMPAEKLGHGLVFLEGICQDAHSEKMLANSQRSVVLSVGVSPPLRSPISVRK